MSKDKAGFIIARKLESEFHKLNKNNICIIMSIDSNNNGNLTFHEIVNDNLWIDENLEKNRHAIVETTSIKTDYTMIRPNEYLATGCIYERGSKLLEVSLNVRSEEDAGDGCRRIKVKNEDVYAQILSLLCMD